MTSLICNHDDAEPAKHNGLCYTSLKDIFIHVFEHVKLNWSVGLFNGGHNTNNANIIFTLHVECSTRLDYPDCNERTVCRPISSFLRLPRQVNINVAAFLVESYRPLHCLHGPCTGDQWFSAASCSWCCCRCFVTGWW